MATAAVPGGPAARYKGDHPGQARQSVSRLPQVTAREMIAALARAGFAVARVKGSHYFLVHESDPTRWATVAVHQGDLRTDSVRDILKRAKCSRSDFLKLL